MSRHQFNGFNEKNTDSRLNSSDRGEKDKRSREDAASECARTIVRKPSVNGLVDSLQRISLKAEDERLNNGTHLIPPRDGLDQTDNALRAANNERSSEPHLDNELAPTLNPSVSKPVSQDSPEKYVQRGMALADDSKEQYEWIKSYYVDQNDEGDT